MIEVFENDTPSGVARPNQNQNGRPYEAPCPSATSSIHFADVGQQSNSYYDIDSFHMQQLRRRSSVKKKEIESAQNQCDADNGSYAKRSSMERAARAARKIDFFDKTESDYQVRTERGGKFTLVGYLIVVVLILAEYVTWKEMNQETLEHIVVDTSLGKKMRVNLNITFPALHCNDLHLDVIDVAGDTQLDISENLLKHRLQLDGTPLDKRQLKKDVPDDYCGPCYGAIEHKGDCCNTCDDVLKKYKKKGWNGMAVIKLSEQCKREGRTKNEPKKMSKGEGCNLSGHMTINRVAGNFHIAMGEGVDKDGRHIHEFLPEDRPNFNASHVIHELSFMDEDYGDFTGGQFDGNMDLPGERSMNGAHKVVTKDTGTTGFFEYHIKVVPTKYKGTILNDLGVSFNEREEKDELETNRYFFTESFRPLIDEINEEAILSGDPDRGTAASSVGGKRGGKLHDKSEDHDSRKSLVPGVGFIYEIYPFAVEVTKNEVPFTHLLIRIMASAGGVFTIVRWIDGAMH